MRRYISLALCWVVIAIATGCRTCAPKRVCNNANAVSAVAERRLHAEPTASESSSSGDPALRTVSFDEPAVAAIDVEPEPQVLLDSAPELSLEYFVAEVQSVNPSVEAMYAAWQAAAQRYPQAVSLDDPMFGTALAPASFGSNNANAGYMVEASQKLPWHGKRALRGATVRAETDGAAHNVETTRQKLAEIAELAYWDYYVSARLLSLNDENKVILESFRDNAESRYENALVTQQDIFQADIELANLEKRRIEIEIMEKTAAGRINVLLRRNPMAALPNAQQSIIPSIDLPDESALLADAVTRRPEISAAAARIREEQSRLELACKQYYPDTEVFGRYDAFWDVSELRSQVGARVNVPVYTGRLNAAVREAGFHVAKARAEYDQMVLEVQSDVQVAYQRVVESQRTVIVYSQKLIPAAEQNVNVARTSYDTSTISFLELALAQRQLVDARERLIEVEAELQRRIATLRRVCGGTLPELSA